MPKKNQKVRLIRKTSQTFLWISFFLILLSTFVLYFYVKNILQQEVEEELHSRTAGIEALLLENKRPYSFPPTTEIEDTHSLGSTILKDTLIFDPSQDEMEEFRELTSFKEVKGQAYKITVRNLVVESGNILAAIVLSYVTIILLVFVFFFYLNKAWNKDLWLPFFTNLKRMKDFSVTSPKPIEFMDSEILEFSELKDEIKNLTDKGRTDYLNLRQFVEDISHELQTPMAMILAKIENAINEDELNEIQYAHLDEIQKDVQRIAQYNKRLALLSKIENRQFTNPKPLYIDEIIKYRIRDFEETFYIRFDYIEKENLPVEMDPYLADILCNNLLSNAVKHRLENSNVVVELNKNTLRVSNQGLHPVLQPDKLFSRYYKESRKIRSTGLGLAIVQKICLLYGFKISYVFEEGYHVFRVKF